MERTRWTNQTYYRCQLLPGLLQFFINQLPFINPFLNLQNGKFAVVGSYDGRCVFYTTEHLKYYTQIHVRSTRGRNSKGRKITGIEPLPNEDKVLSSSNLYFYTVFQFNFYSFRFWLHPTIVASDFTIYETSICRASTRVTSTIPARFVHVLGNYQIRIQPNWDRIPLL